MNRIHVLNQALDVIHHELTSELTATSLARRLGYSRSALDKIFVETLGDTPARHIRDGRMRRAAHDLIHTRRRILDIALDSGFASQEAFTRAFRRAYRRAPEDYRRSAPRQSLWPRPSLRPHEFARARIRVVQVWQPA
jgi:AraC family transcriptional regulator